jgi:hypothetical protein
MREIWCPKITESEWGYKRKHKDNNVSYLRIGQENHGFNVWSEKSEDDAQAMSLVPELLEIYKKARNVCDEFQECDDMHQSVIDGMELLKKAINCLENRVYDDKK